MSSWNRTSDLTRLPGPTPASITSSSRDDATPTTTSPLDNAVTETGDEDEPEETGCVPSKEGAAPTTYSIVYTSTTTIYGTQPYTPPYETITTPVTCKPASAPEPERTRATYDLSVTCSTFKGRESCTTFTSSRYQISWAPPPEETTTSIGKHLETPSKTYTFLTTDKNPSVVYMPEPTLPDYGRTATGPKINTHNSAPGDDTISMAQTRAGGPESMKMLPLPEFKVTAGPSTVAINTLTITPAAGATTTVTVDGGVFVINPSQIIGAGSTVDRPVPAPGAFLPTSTSTNVGGLPVVITSSQAIIGGATFSIGPTPTTVTIDGQTISIGLNGVGFVGQSVTVGAPPVQTEVVIAGGEMLTAIGKSVVVIHSTTFTYGPGIAPRTEVVDDDTIVVGPSGVVVHGTTIGGPSAGTGETIYEIIGGATLTQIGSSVLVVGGKTYTVGPGAAKTTAVVGGETITIGPDGVAVSTMSFPYPFGPTVITTLKPGATAAVPTPAETQTQNAATSTRPGWEAGTIGLCIAIGVWILGLAV